MYRNIRAVVSCLVVLGFLFAIGITINVQPVHAQKKEGPRRLSIDPGSLRAETPTISAGAEFDLMKQKNPEMFRSKGIRKWPAKPKTAFPQILDPLAPPLDYMIEGINFNEDAANDGFFHIPPDPAVAVGPAHLVTVNNTSIEWFDKATMSTELSSALDAFFVSEMPLTSTFDPKVIYDQYAGRFVVLTMERTEDDGLPMPMVVNSSRVFLAVSKTSDPNMGWWFLTLITEETIGVNESWADFPGLAVDSEAVYFTTNMFAHDDQPGAGAFTGQRTWIIAKAPWYTGGVPVFAAFDTVLAAGGGAIATTMQPTQMYGDMPGGVGTYLIAYSGISGGGMVALQVITITTPLGVPGWATSFITWGTTAADDDTTMAFPDAPQSGTTREIATNDRRFSQNGVFRDGFLYAAAPILPPTGTDMGQVTVHWFKFDPTTTVITDQGNIGGEDIATGAFTFFPSVAVDWAGNMAVGFAASAPSIFPGAYYTGRLAGDPAGTTQAVGTLALGADFYIRDFTASTTVDSRWGDYSGMWLDPSDEVTFCAYNEYALMRGAPISAEEDGRWGTRIGCFRLITVTAADVPISGRVLAPSGRGVRNAIVHLTEEDGDIKIARSNHFGYYSIPEVETGQTVIINAYSKQYQFTTQVVSVEDAITGLNFIAQGKADFDSKRLE